MEVKQNVFYAVKNQLDYARIPASQFRGCRARPVVYLFFTSYIYLQK